jgi:hypothetical protein
VRTDGTTAQYRLRVPQNGMRACTVPARWIWMQTRHTVACATGREAEEYLLEI